MYYYGARYYDPRISIFVSVDPLAEKTMTPYQYVTNNPIMFTDPTGMSQEGGGGGFWNSVRSFFGMSSTEKPVQQNVGDDDDATLLDEIFIDGRKPNWFQRNFSKDKLANDWKNIKEKSGWNHFVNYDKDMAGGTGGIRFLGFGGISTEGRGEIKGKMKSIKVGDMSTYSFAPARIIQHWVEALSKGVSIAEDENVRKTVMPGNVKNGTMGVTQEQDRVISFPMKKYSLDGNTVRPHVHYREQIYESQKSEYQKMMEQDSMNLLRK